eukprot:Gb_22555 [translate_table: standard]
MLLLKGLENIPEAGDKLREERQRLAKLTYLAFGGKTERLHFGTCKVFNETPNIAKRLGLALVNSLHNLVGDIPNTSREVLREKRETNQDLGEMGSSLASSYQIEELQPWMLGEGLPEFMGASAGVGLGLTILDSEGNLWVKTNKGEKVEGKAYVNINKGKVIPGYEISIKLSWTVEAKDNSSNSLPNVEGTVDLPYIANENADEDPELKVSIKDDDPIGQRLQEAFLNQSLCVEKAVAKPLGLKFAMVKEGFKTIVLREKLYCEPHDINDIPMDENRW